MATTIEALLDLQKVERELAVVRSKLKTRTNAVNHQNQRIDQLRAEHDALRDRATSRRMDADRLELALKEEEEKVGKLRTALNTAKTNKEYATILTQINSTKADNAKVEDQVLRIMQDADNVTSEAEGLKQKVELEQRRLADLEASSAGQIARLNEMFAELTARREQCAKAVPPTALAAFDRIAQSYDGDAMAAVEQHGKRPPYHYVCGGCFMSLNPEHANALRVRDEVRRCDNCGRILYLQPTAQNTPA